MKKLKKIFKFFFKTKYYMNVRLPAKLGHNIKKIVTKNALYEITLLNDFTVYARDFKHSDLHVFKQIFGLEEYRIVYKILELNNDFKEDTIIIDAGANVGYTSVYFCQFFDNLKIFAVEPSAENAKLYLKNTKNISNCNVIKLYQKALSHKTGLQYCLDRNFRDQKDWAIATSENPEGDIAGISVDEIIEENNLTHISLLKIDIEGAERFIFNEDNDLSFLKITRVVALEIHDEFNIRESINAILKEHDFLIFESGELTIGMNKLFYK
jgi:FkbM family methyltransferase